MGRPYFASYKNSKPSNFSEVSIGTEFRLINSIFAVSPILSINRFLYSSEKYFSKSENGYIFINVPDTNYNLNRLELFTINVGIEFSVQRKVNNRVFFTLKTKPLVGVNISNSNVFYQNGKEVKTKTDNNPLLYGGDISVGLKLISPTKKNTFRLEIGVLALNGKYIASSNFKTLTPYGGMSYSFIVRGFGKVK